MKNYKFRTSLGFVEIAFDPDQFEPHKVDRRGDYKEFDCIKDFEWIEGQEFIDVLYDYSGTQIIKSSDGGLWFMVGLSDPWYGLPEYFLEEVSNDN